MTLNEVMKDTADAIREKKGKSDLIAPVNFAEEIKGITSGGGESSTIEYLDVSGDEYNGLREVLCTSSIYVKGSFGNTKFTGYPFSFFGGGVSPENISALAIDFLAEVGMLQDGVEEKANIARLLSRMVSQEQLDSIPRISKEQFYTLE